MLKNPLKYGEVKLPQLGWIKFRQSRPIPEGFELKQARIIRKATGYFVQLILQLEVNVVSAIPKGKAIGIDLGLTHFLASSDGDLIARPRFFKTLQRQLKLLQRRLKKKQKGSKNWYKLNKRIAKLHFKIAETRKDFHFKVAHYLCDIADLIFAENINFKAWGHNCGKKTLSNRVHKCPKCSYENHRDIASSEVIRNRGLNAVGQSVSQNACGDVLTGIREVQYLFGLVKCL